MSSFRSDINAQPDALLTLLGQLAQHGAAPLRANEPLQLVGMGASYHAACIAQMAFLRAGHPCHVIEAGDVVHGFRDLDQGATLIYLSQSGASAEVLPVLGALPGAVRVLGLTNQPNSPLGQRADVVLPLHAGAETTVATKTYLNTLALLWWLAGTDVPTLRALAGQVSALLADADAHVAAWLGGLVGARHLVFVGHGAQAISARQAAMMVAEWAKRPATHASIGAFRHGFIETVDAHTGVVVYSAPGAGQTSAYGLAAELRGYGARVLVVEGGRVLADDDATTPPDAANGVAPAPDAALYAPLLDAIPAQLFAEALARHDGVPPGFRYISKVVKTL